MGGKILLKYLLSRGEKQYAFAARAGVSNGALSDWISGKHMPSVYSAYLIERATDGAVPIASWARVDGRRQKRAVLQ